MEEVANKEMNVVAVNSPNAITKETEHQQLPLSNEVFNSQRGLSSINLLSEAELTRAKCFLGEIIRSEKGGIKSINDGLAVIMRAQDLNIPFSTALEHVHVINGKTGIDIHVVKALLLRAGVTWENINDYTPLYEYTDSINVYLDNSFPDYVIRCKSSEEAKEKSDKDSEHVYVYPVKYYQDFNGNIYKDYTLNSNQFAIVANKAQANKAVAEKKIPIFRIPNKPVDFISKYKLKRNVNGKEMTVIGSFTYSEAQIAGFFEKDTYKKYPKILIGHRAFTYAARDIASDVILGAFETTELKIMTGTNIDDDDSVDIQG